MAITNNKSKVVVLLSGLLISTIALSGCSSELEPSPIVLDNGSSSSNSDSISEDQLSAPTIPSAVTLPEGSTAFGVVTAALLISSGDVNKAISEGLVTPTEVKYAMLAIKDGTINLWREIAEKEAK